MRVATITVAGFVSAASDAEAVADQFWQMHSEPAASWEVEVVYTPQS